MNTFKKVIFAMLLSFVSCVCAEQVMPEAAPEAASEVVQNVVKPDEQAPVQVTKSSAVIDDSHENQELEKYLQELSQEFEEADSKK
jgi:hypothetical protein